ncbi:hypothetical protein GCM10010106_24890 [Thermopolyspora flexuosa]|jgi:hypothetical protein|uniref:Uncharacterized protein n=1 Tax=Thermopolyspora flexuosa TaxID=103836 RepID=A0A543IVK3_9ACTN|nr:hypothetical protein [Thermopolyspora flexuosa]PZN16231.1 MAG: hypothetical protein DIU75_20010 [Mycolicibacterium hassiacum]TQM74598.1 hypothetical protein FHX40_1278 [Thermopolyspora flexuosa]GGM77458.1 hypothetical protein GCM10010106_24890 [Thermopolyspora flexuosa]
MDLYEASRDERFPRLVNLLITKTKAGQVQWEVARIPDDGESDGFSFSTRRSTVIIGSVKGDGQAPFYLSILNEHGFEVERILAEPPDLEVGPDETRESARFRYMQVSHLLNQITTLYKQARRVALQTDQVIDHLLQDLAL